MAKPKDKTSLIADITNRYRVTAREARDIVTAVSNVARTVTDSNVRGYGVKDVTKKDKAVTTSIARVSPGETRAKAVRNVAKQVGEVYTAATKGKSGTKSAQIKSVKNKAGQTIQENYALETKRKQGGKK